MVRDTTKELYRLMPAIHKERRVTSNILSMLLIGITQTEIRQKLPSLDSSVGFSGHFAYTIT